MDASTTSLEARFQAIALAAEQAVRTADLTELTRLAKGAEDAMREATMTGIAAAARARVPVDDAVGSLVLALGDPASGVRYAAVDGLFAAVQRGADLSKHTRALDAAIDDLSLDDEGWAFGVFPTTGETTGRRLDPGVDLAGILAKHHANVGDQAALDSMVAAGGTRAYSAKRVLPTA